MRGSAALEKNAFCTVVLNFGSDQHSTHLSPDIEGHDVFAECNRLREVTLNEGLQRIGACAFRSNATSLARHQHSLDNVGSRITMRFLDSTRLSDVAELRGGAADNRGESIPSGAVASLERITIPSSMLRWLVRGAFSVLHATYAELSSTRGGPLHSYTRCF